MPTLNKIWELPISVLFQRRQASGVERVKMSSKMSIEDTGHPTRIKSIIGSWRYTIDIL